MDLEEDATCEDLEEGSFCDDLTNCAVSHCIDDSQAPDYCTTEAEALDDCAAEAYPDEYDDEEECPGLCEPGTADSSGGEEIAIA